VSNEAWKAAYRNFDPMQPAMPAWRAPRPGTPLGRIQRDLDAGVAAIQRLLVGTQGTGKSTELRALAESQPVASRRAVLVDLRRHFDVGVKDPAAIEQVEPWEIVLLIGLAVQRALESLGHPDAAIHRSSLARAAKPLLPEDEAATLDMGALVTGIGVASLAVGAAFGSPGTATLGTGLAAVGSAGTKQIIDMVSSVSNWTLRLRAAGAEEIPDTDARVVDLLTAVNAALSELKIREEPALLAIDGLDTLTDPERQEKLFVRTSLFERLNAHVIGTAPVALRRTGLANRCRIAVQRVGEVDVLDRDEPGDEARSRPDALAFFTEVLRLRLDGGAMPDPAVVRRLAHASGGRVRDFVRFYRDVLLASRTTCPTLAQVDEILDDYRIQTVEAGLTRDDIDLLRALRDDRERALPSGERAQALLETLRILPYVNGGEWYFPHPLMLRPHGKLDRA
jgi:hypothetical protein